MDPAPKRLFLISQHFTSSPYHSQSLSVNKDLLFDLYFDSSASDIRQLRQKAVKSPFFDFLLELQVPYDETRSRTLERISFLYDKSEITFETDQRQPLKKLSMMYVFAEYDKATTTRILVHAVLFIDSLQTLGTAKHMPAINRAYSLTDYGCFAMTELGHGSNVLALETTATFIKETKEFEINSPTATSAKWWIGAAGKSANVAVVFAQLIVEGENKGVHAFYVPIRDSQHKPCSGVVIGDCGPKISLNAIDNGFILFRKYRVKYECLLDKFSGVNSEGKFKSNIKNAEKRFAAMLAGLIRGRLAVVSSAEICLRSSLGIAYRFLKHRTVDSEDFKGKMIDSQVFYVKAVQALGNLVAFRAGLRYLLRTYERNYKVFAENPDGEELAEYHTMISTLKPVSSWICNECHEELQDLCGQFGNYLQASIGRIKSNQDINITWEGDNTVLIQQVGKYVFKQIRNTFKGLQVSSKILAVALIPQQVFGEQKSGIDEFCAIDDLIAALRYKFNYFTYKSLEKLQQNAQKSEFLTDAWNKTQAFHIQELGKAFGEYLMAVLNKEFCEEVKGKCEKTGEVLFKVMKVFVLQKIVKGSAVLMEGFMNVGQMVDVRRELLRICGEIREVGLDVIEALVPPDQILFSDIGESGEGIEDRVFERANLVQSRKSI